MKFISKLSMVAYLLSLTVTTSFAYAEGVGHIVESQFRTKVEGIMTDMMSWPKPALKAAVGVNPILILENLKIPKKIQVLCATNDALNFLKEQKTLAYVGADPLKDQNVISLDCGSNDPYNTMPSDKEGIDKLEIWLKLFNSTNPEDLIFFVHQALRNAGINDDNYVVSRNYMKGHLLRSDEQEAVFNRLSTPHKNDRCFITFYENKDIDSYGMRAFGSPIYKRFTQVYVELKIDRQQVLSMPLFYINHWPSEEDQQLPYYKRSGQFSLGNYLSILLNDPRGSEAKYLIYQKYKSFGCDLK